MTSCLLVEPSGVVRKVARRILQREGMEVEEAPDGREALADCMVAVPEIVMVDAAVPDMEVTDFIRQLRSMPGGHAPKILVCLVELDVPAIMRAKRAGADGFMLKPFDRSQILAAFETIGQPAAARAA